MYCEDVADAIWFCANKIEELPQTTNIGIGKDYTIREYYQCISKVIGYEGGFSSIIDKPEGMKQKLIDSTNINKLGWAPKFSLLDGLNATYNYFINNFF